MTLTQTIDTKNKTETFQYTSAVTGQGIIFRLHLSFVNQEYLGD